MPPSRLEKHAFFVKTILNETISKNKINISTATLSQCQVLAEIIFNVLHNILELDDLNLTKFKRWKNLYRKIANKSTPSHTRAIYIKQHPIPVLKLLFAVRNQILKKISEIKK